MIKYLKSFHKELMKQGIEIAELIYGLIVLIPFYTIASIVHSYGNITISNLLYIPSVAGTILLIKGTWDLIEKDIKQFFKNVKNNIN